MPFFSIITVHLNDIEGLRQTIQSVEQQSYVDYEQLIIDGGSTDGTQRYLKDLELKTNFKITSEADNGLYDAMNKGVGKATGDYLIFLNAGDSFFDTNVLVTVSRDIVANKSPDIFYGGVIEVTTEGVEFYKSPKPPTTIWNTTPTRHQAIFYKRSVAKKYRYLDELKIAADVAYTAQIILDSNTVTMYRDYPISRFAQGGVSYTRNMQVLRENWHIRRHVFRFGRIKSSLIVTYRYLVRIFEQRFGTIYNKLRY